MSVSISYLLENAAGSRANGGKWSIYAGFALLALVLILCAVGADVNVGTPSLIGP